MTKRILFLIVLLGLLVIACTLPKPTRTVVITKQLDDTKSIELCLNVTCGSNTYCSWGSCVCNQGFKVCADQCILNDSCCSNSDCSIDQTCRSGICASIPSTPVEKPNAILNPQINKTEQLDVECKSNQEKTANNQCTCRQGTRWCDSQYKCIPLDDCCISAECRGTKYCQPFTTSANVCFQTAVDGKVCQRIPQGRTTSIMLASYGFKTNVSNAMFADWVTLDLNGITYSELVEEDTVPFNDGIKIWIDDISVHGGKCVTI